MSGSVGVTEVSGSDGVIGVTGSVDGCEGFSVSLVFPPLLLSSEPLEGSDGVIVPFPELLPVPPVFPEMGQ